MTDSNTHLKCDGPIGNDAAHVERNGAFDAYSSFCTDNDVCWIFVGSPCERHPCFVRAACMAVNFAMGCEVHDPFDLDDDEDDEERRKEKSASTKEVIENLKKSNETFVVLWQVKGAEPELDHSGDYTTREAWEEILYFLQHDLWFCFGDSVW